MATLELNLEFGGGMELLFDNKQRQKVSIPKYYDEALLRSDGAPDPLPAVTEGKDADVRFLIWWMRHYLLADKQRPELFSQGDSIRPGILILINSADWELEGELDYKLASGDELVFISTLHGG